MFVTWDKHEKTDCMDKFVVQSIDQIYIAILIFLGWWLCDHGETSVEIAWVASRAGWPVPWFMWNVWSLKQPWSSMFRRATKCWKHVLSCVILYLYYTSSPYFMYYTHRLNMDNLPVSSCICTKSIYNDGPQAWEPEYIEGPEAFGSRTGAPERDMRVAGSRNIGPCSGG